jgi:hypothetical protein
VNEVSEETGKHKWFATVYESVSGTDEYPQQGNKLNNPSVVTFHGIFCKSRKPEKIAAFPDKLAASLADIGGTFVSYEAKKGTLSFRVPHWSRYEIEIDVDDSDSEEGESPKSKLPLSAQKKRMMQRKKNYENVDMLMSSSSSEDELVDDGQQNGGGGGMEAESPRLNKHDPNMAESPIPSPAWPHTPQTFTSPFSQPLSNLSARFYGGGGGYEPSPFQSPFAKPRFDSATTTHDEYGNMQVAIREDPYSMKSSTNENVFERDDDDIADGGSMVEEGEGEEYVGGVHVDARPEWYSQPIGLEPKEEVPLPSIPRYFRTNDNRCSTLVIYGRALQKLQQQGRIPGKELKRSTRMSLDMGLSMGRSFRASFGPNGQLVLPFAFAPKQFQSHQMMMKQASSKDKEEEDEDDDDVMIQHENELKIKDEYGDCYGYHHAISIIPSNHINASRVIQESKTFMKLMETIRKLSIYVPKNDESLSNNQQIVLNKTEDNTPVIHTTNQFRLPRGIALSGKNIDEKEYPVLATLMQQCCGITAASSTMISDDDVGGENDKDDEMMRRERCTEWSTSHLWLLSRALWGQEPVNLNRRHIMDSSNSSSMLLPVTARSSSHQYRKNDPNATLLKQESKRLNMIQHWLKSAVKGSCETSSNQNQSWRKGRTSREDQNQDEYHELGLGFVLDMLSEGRHSEATKIAMKEAKSPRLALMIASMSSHGGGSREVAYYVQGQLRNWHANGAIKFIPLEIRLIYTILAGDSYLLNPISGYDHQDNHEINDLQNDDNDDGSNYDERSCMKHDELKCLGLNLDWLRRLGLNLWYHVQPFPCLRNAFVEYNLAVKSGYAHPPTPVIQSYISKQKDSSSTMNDDVLNNKGKNNNDDEKCVLHHLLELYCREEDDSSCDIILKALSPKTITDDVLDMRHSWQLCLLLQSLGLYEMPNEEKYNSICDSLASQLISANKWQWACYIY